MKYPIKTTNKVDPTIEERYDSHPNKQLYDKPQAQSPPLSDDEDEILYPSFFSWQRFMYAFASLVFQIQAFLKSTFTFKLPDIVLVNLAVTRKYWFIVFLGFFSNYLHGVGHNFAYLLHEQRPVLKDLGFMLLPSMPKSLRVLSECIFLPSFLLGFALIFGPNFVRMYNPKGEPLISMNMVRRYVFSTVALQFIRVSSFLSTMLPGPAPHCHIGSPTYHPPQSMFEVFFVFDLFEGCGDLMVSSHTLFLMLCVCVVYTYINSNFLKRAYPPLIFIFSLLCISSRKHYTVDIIAAVYFTPLVWCTTLYFLKDQTIQECIDIAAEYYGKSWTPPTVKSLQRKE